MPQNKSGTASGTRTEMKVVPFTRANEPCLEPAGRTCRIQRQGCERTAAGRKAGTGQYYPPHPPSLTLPCYCSSPSPHAEVICWWASQSLCRSCIKVTSHGRKESAGSHLGYSDTFGSQIPSDPTEQACLYPWCSLMQPASPPRLVF